MYTVKCDGHPLLDVRDDEYILVNPNVKVEVNTVGEASFTIYNNHPNYEKLKIKKSVFEVADEIGVIFRGRMTEHTIDFNNGKAVDLEGAMAFFNDSVVPQFNFPEDFLEDPSYLEAADRGNVVEFFLNWLIENHNSQVEDFQKFKLGIVTVSDHNNYITRSSESISNTWESLKAKLFDSSLGGFLCIRYEEDGNYIDYLSEFTMTNTQNIEFGENLLDLKHGTDSTETYSAIIPIGAEYEVSSGENDEIEQTTTKSKLTIESIHDGAITDDIHKITLQNGLHALYSKSSVEKYGWICAPVTETTWSDVTDVKNLLTKGKEWILSQGIMLNDTVEITAVDLHLTDEEIRSFRIYRKINVFSKPHGIEETYDLTKLNIDLLNPQNTKITTGETRQTLTEITNKEWRDSNEKIEEAKRIFDESTADTNELKQQILNQSTSIMNSSKEIIMGALESYVSTGNYEEFKKTIESQFSLISDNMQLKFSETFEDIQNVNGDLQKMTNTLLKYFDFSLEDGLIIKAGENKMQLQLDNDIVSFKKNGQQFGWWDGIDFHTGNIIIDVNERAQFGNFAFVPRSDGSLSFLKVGD